MRVLEGNEGGGWYDNTFIKFYKTVNPAGLVNHLAKRLYLRKGDILKAMFKVMGGIIISLMRECTYPYRKFHPCQLLRKLSLFLLSLA